MHVGFLRDIEGRISRAVSEVRALHLIEIVAVLWLNHSDLVLRFLEATDVVAQR